MLCLLLPLFVQGSVPPPTPEAAGARRPAQARERAAERERQRALELAQRVLTIAFQEDRVPDLGREELLARLRLFDRDEDGRAGLEEFRSIAAWSPARPRGERDAVKPEEAWSLLLRHADADGDGFLAHAEALAFFDARDLDGDGLLTRSERADGPRVGEQAPDFALPAPGGEDLHALSELLAGGKPVALLFGSYT